jgi:hypothetical protein
MNIGIYIHESYQEFDMEQCINDVSQDLFIKPLPCDYQLFFVFENSSTLISSQQKLQVFDLHRHPNIDVLVVVKQSIYNPSHELALATVSWLRKTAQKAQLVSTVFFATQLLDKLAIFTNLKMLKPSQKQRYTMSAVKPKRLANNRLNSELIASTKQSLPEAILACLHILHKLDANQFKAKNSKQLQFDL